MLLRALGIADQQIPGDVAGACVLVPVAAADRRVLVVLDNAASEDQVGRCCRAAARAGPW